jgi:protein TonB
MERDLFQFTPERSSGARQRYTVPISVLTHGVLIAALVVAPIVVAGQIPLPAAILVLTAAVPPPPPTRPASRPQPVRTEAITLNPDAAPPEAPDELGPEPEPSMAALVASEPGRMGGLEQPSGTQSLLRTPPPAPVVKTEPRRLRPGGDLREPRRTHYVAPEYPAIARTARVEGTVIIEATIGRDGQVRDAVVLRSIAMLDQAALAAVRQWRYTPTLLNGVPVDVLLTITVHFSLR